MTVARAVVEDGPGGTALVHRVEDRVAFRVVERFDVGAREVENDGVVLALAHLHNQIATLCRFTGAGRSESHRMRLLEPMGERDFGELVGLDDYGGLDNGDQVERRRVCKG